MVDCAKKNQFKYIFRITGDNPYIDYDNYKRLKLLSKKKHIIIKNIFSQKPLGNKM